MPDDRDRPTEPTRPVRGDAAERLRQFTLLAPGSEFAGRYRIEARIGGGGAGEVYRALDELSGTRVALKVLFPRGEDPRTLERLRRELRLVRGLSHPGIVRIHDIGEHAGLLYLVMELLEGETLRERMARARLAPGDVLAFFEQVLDALAAAHAAGVVHRDVKPGNIVLTRTAGPAGAEHGAGAAAPEHAVLLDFGLARADDERALTRTGDFLGTPEYVAPEQARAEKNVGPPADVYSAGIVLWEMIAGRPPFEGNSQVEILMAHAQRPLPPPRRALAAAPGWLRDLAAWMLEKDPARRPADAGVALAFLRRRRRAPLGRRWRAAGRARGGAARRTALVASVLLLAAALAGAALLPVRASADDRFVTIRSALGIRLRTVETPFLAMRPTSLRDGLRGVGRFLVGQMRDPLTPRDAPALLTLETWGGDPVAVRFTPDVEAKTCRTVFPGLSCSYGLSCLVRIPESIVPGPPAFVAILTHLVEYTNLLVVFDARGVVHSWLPFAGAIQDPLFLPAGDDPSQPALLIASVEFHDLGQRLGILAFRAQLRARGPAGDRRDRGRAVRSAVD